MLTKFKVETNKYKKKQRIQTLRVFRRAAKVDASKELKFERPVDEGGPKPDQEANLEAKSELRSPT